jgi:hypothetical protein
LQAAEEATGRLHPRLHPDPIPDCFERQMALWLELHQGRSAGWGLTPLSWQDMSAFCFVTGEALSRNDVRIIRLIEAEFFASREAAEERRQKSAERKARPDGK